MNAESLQEMLRKDRLEWASFTAVLDSHPEEKLYGLDSAPWSNRDVYAHLTRWMEHSNQARESYREGRTLSHPSGTDDEINERWRLEDKGLTLAEARIKACAAFDQRLQIIRTVPLELWDKKLEEIVLYDGWMHFSAHRGYVRTK
jgi:hypothetical protein